MTNGVVDGRICERVESGQRSHLNINIFGNNSVLDCCQHSRATRQDGAVAAGNCGHCGVVARPAHVVACAYGVTGCYIVHSVERCNSLIQEHRSCSKQSNRMVGNSHWTRIESRLCCEVSCAGVERAVGESRGAFTRGCGCRSTVVIILYRTHQSVEVARSGGRGIAIHTAFVCTRSDYITYIEVVFLNSSSS